MNHESASHVCCVVLHTPAVTTLALCLALQRTTVHQLLLYRHCGSSVKGPQDSSLCACSCSYCACVPDTWFDHADISSGKASLRRRPPPPPQGSQSAIGRTSSVATSSPTKAPAESASHREGGQRQQQQTASPLAEHQASLMFSVSMLL